MKKGSNIFRDAKNDFKKDYILRAIRSSKGNLTVAAKRMGLSKQALFCIFDILGIKKQVKQAVSGFKHKENPGIERLKTNKYQEAVHDFEKEYLKKHILMNRGFLMKTARQLGVHRNSITYKVLEYKLGNFVDKVRRKRRGREAVK